MFSCCAMGRSSVDAVVVAAVVAGLILVGARPLTGTDTSKAKLKNDAAMRAQIRAIRMALKIKLAALHH